MIRRRSFAQGMLVEVEGFAGTPVSLGVGQNLPAIAAKPGDQLAHFGWLEVGVARGSARDAEGATAEPRFQIRIIEQHRSAVG